MSEIYMFIESEFSSNQHLKEKQPVVQRNTLSGGPTLLRFVVLVKYYHFMPLQVSSHVTDTKFFPYKAYDQLVKCDLLLEIKF